MHTMKTNQIIFDFQGHMFPAWFVFMFLTKKEHVGETQRVIWMVPALWMSSFSVPRVSHVIFLRISCPAGKVIAKL